MTLYNKGPYVEEAVHSVLRNSFRDLELLVVDDGSTDDGGQRVLVMDDERIRLISSSTNTGRGASANRGFDNAKGEFVAILDADDMAHPERFERQVSYLEGHPEVGACGSQVRIIGSREHIAHWPLTDREARSRMLFEDPILYGATMFRRSVLEEHHLRCDEQWNRPGMDYLFLLGVAAHTLLANLPEVLTSYRTGPNNFLHGRELLEERANTFSEVFRLLGIPATEEQVDLHLLLNRQFRRKPDPSTVRALFDWVEHLRNWNRGSRSFPEKEFETRLDHDLDRMYYVLADRWPACAIEHLRLMGGWPGQRLAYLMKTRTRVLLTGDAHGRKSNVDHGRQ